MNDHLSTSQLQALAVGHLAEGEYGKLARHIAACEQCNLMFITAIQDPEPLCSFSLESAFWFKHDHLTFGQLTSLVDDTADHESLSIIDAHLNSCALCRESVDSILLFREGTQELKESEGSAIASRDLTSAVLFNKRVAWHPAYLVAAAILITLATLTSLVLISKRSKSSAPEPTVAVTMPSSNSTSASPVETQGTYGSTGKENELVAVLNDGPREVAIYRDGRIEGLQSVSWTTAQEVSRAVLSGRLRTPNVLKELAPGSGSLRGSNDRAENFKLIYPARQVIIEERPRFRWQSVTGVSSYQVYVVNSDGKEVARSEVLPPSQLHWTPQNSLRRGEVFDWTVVAVIDQKEVISPPSSEPEMRFAVLSDKDKKELDELNKSKSHLARGIFFARTGLLAEAEAEFDKLVQINPQSPIPRTLLKNLQAVNPIR